MRLASPAAVFTLSDRPTDRQPSYHTDPPVDQRR